MSRSEKELTKQEFEACLFIADVREEAKRRLADPMESPGVVARYLDECLACLQTDFGMKDPRT